MASKKKLMLDSIETRRKQFTKCNQNKTKNKKLFNVKCASKFVVGQLCVRVILIHCYFIVIYIFISEMLAVKHKLVTFCAEPQALNSSSNIQSA